MCNRKLLQKVNDFFISQEVFTLLEGLAGR
jgi:hypothetical protein